MPTSRLGLMVCLAIVHAAAALAVPVDQASLAVTVADVQPTVGDTVTVRVAAHGGVDVMWGELSVQVSESGPWAVAGGPDEVPGSSPPVWELELVALEVGELELPELSVSLRASQQDAITVSPETVPTVTVASVLGAEDDATPAPLHDPHGVGGFPWEWVGPLFVALLPFVVAAAWWWRRRRVAGGVDGAAPRLPPFEEFERHLKDVRSRIGHEPAELICDRLAVGLRLYLERRSGEPAVEMTSHELRVLARREHWPSTVQTDLHLVLGVADGVRFGRRPVNDGELMRGRDAALDLGRSLEEHFRPVPASGEGA